MIIISRPGIAETLSSPRHPILLHDTALCKSIYETLSRLAFQESEIDKTRFA